MDTATNRLEWAEQLIAHAVELMTPDQVGAWEGVRAWQEVDFFCEWSKLPFGRYETSCEKIFDTYAGAPSENNFKWCPFCGRELLMEPTILSLHHDIRNHKENTKQWKTNAGITEFNREFGRQNAAGPWCIT